jgi:thiol-disulfide isomerase/thioredoxin
LLVLFITILFIVAAIYGYKWYSGRLLEKNQGKDVANANRVEKPMTIYYFYTTWCPYCQKAEPEWDNFYTKYNNTDLNGYMITCIKVECDETSNPQTSALMQKYNVQQFPTVKMVTDQGTIDFEARVTTNNLVSFVNTVSE